MDAENLKFFLAHAPVVIPDWFERKRWKVREIVPAPECGYGYVKHVWVDHLETQENHYFRWRKHYAEKMLGLLPTT